jgi:hypothetical protein
MLSLSTLTPNGQPLDTETAREFMKETLNKVAREELEAIEAELREKSRRMRALLAPDSLPHLTDEYLTNLLRSIFATRRRAKDILKAISPEEFKTAVAHLLHDSAEADIRFQQFVDTMTGYIGDVRVLRPRKSSDSRAKQSAEDAALHDNIFCDLGSELLHFTNPDEYWLWTRWIWDPQAGTGAMPLVTNEGIDLFGNTGGETYLKLGIATTFVKATGDAAGFSNFGEGPFGVDVFLVCVYAVYMYTTLRLRMTQEFNKVVPQLPELTRRLLGVWKMEI